MTAHAVSERTWSGTAPCEAEDGPGKHQQTHLPVPTVPIFRRKGDLAVEDTVSPPREGRATDASKLSFPLPLTISAVVFALSIGAAVWSIKTDVQLINLRLEYEAKIRVGDKENVDQQFKALEAKIDAAGLRNYNMSLITELQKAQEKLKGR